MIKKDQLFHWHPASFEIKDGLMISGKREQKPGSQFADCSKKSRSPNPDPASFRGSNSHQNQQGRSPDLPDLWPPSQPAWLVSGIMAKSFSPASAGRDHSCATVRDSHTVPFLVLGGTEKLLIY